MANIRCAEIAAEQLKALQHDQAWLALEQEAALGVVPGFGERAVSLIESNLAGAAAAAHVAPDMWQMSMLWAAQCGSVDRPGSASISSIAVFISAGYSQGTRVLHVARVEPAAGKHPTALWCCFIWSVVTSRQSSLTQS